MTGLHRKKPKVYKKCNIIDIRHEPKGGGGPQLDKSGLTQEEDKPITEANPPYLCIIPPWVESQ